MKKISPLTKHEFEYINWTGPFTFDKLIRIRTEMDGSCFFHAIAKSYFKPYITGKIDDKNINRKKFVRNLRKDLSKTLGQKIDPSNPNSLTYYETISNGELPNISNKYSLRALQKELDSTQPVSNIYNEFISNQLNKDIYILDGVKQDVYMTGTPDDLLYKNRDSIVILYIPGHYELIGVKNEGYIKTLFKHNDELIQAIRSRMKKLQKN